VRLLHDVPQALLPGVYAACDAFVLASRGEGWGRPHSEAMAMGLPVLATNWSGSTEFMHDANSYPLRVAALAPIPDGAFAGHLQAEVDVGALRATMRAVVREQAAAAGRGALARQEMRTRWSPAAMAARLEQLARDAAGDAAAAAARSEL
jgi:glycosyltransferase involved in cell wall biosynthesis